MSVLIVVEKHNVWLNGNKLETGIPVSIGDDLMVTLDRSQKVAAAHVSRSVVRLYTVQLDKDGSYLLADAGGSRIPTSTGSPVKGVLDAFGLGRRIARKVDKERWELSMNVGFPVPPNAPMFKWYYTDGLTSVIEKKSHCTRVKVVDYNVIVLYITDIGKPSKPTSIIYRDDTAEVAGILHGILTSIISDKRKTSDPMPDESIQEEETSPPRPAVDIGQFVIIDYTETAVEDGVYNNTVPSQGGPTKPSDGEAITVTAPKTQDGLRNSGQIVLGV